MFGIPASETVVIVEAKNRGKHAKLLHNLVGTKDDDECAAVGPVDGSVQATIFDERLFKDNLLSSEQKIIFVGRPDFAREYLEALDSVATNRVDEHGVHIAISGKQASISVDGSIVSREDYWAFLDYAASCGQELPDLLADLRGGDDAESESALVPQNNNPLEAIGGFFGGVAKVVGGAAKGVGDQVLVASKAGDIEDQKYQFAIKYFYLEKLRAFAEE